MPNIIINTRVKLGFHGYIEPDFSFSPDLDRFDLLSTVHLGLVVCVGCRGKRLEPIQRRRQTKGFLGLRKRL